MKKFLCIAISLLMLISASLISVPAAPEENAMDNGVLIVSGNGQNPTEVEVGNEFIVFIGLYAGPDRILNGQVHMEFDTNYVEFVPYELTSDDGEDKGIQFYSFPSKIRNAGIVYNYDTPGVLNYNFTKASGISACNDPSKLFARFRFKATAAGTTDISHIIQYMINNKEEHIYYKDTPSETINPYMVITIEPAEGLIGDADGDHEVTIMDVTYIQRYCAGADLKCDPRFADFTGDDAVSLKDAVVLRKYLVGQPVTADIGEWVFASES